MVPFRLVSSLVLICVLSAGAAASDWPHVRPVENYGAYDVASWLNSKIVINAIKRQNADNASLPQTKIDALDKRWRSERKQAARPLIDSVMKRPLSRFLAKIQGKSKGLITEVFVMDNKGLNVGQSAVTSDYWQGDEAKWKKTFLVGPQAVHIGNIEFDESTQKFQSQLSLPIRDDRNGKVIGAITLGIDLSAFERIHRCSMLNGSCDKVKFTGINKGTKLAARTK